MKRLSLYSIARFSFLLTLAALLTKPAAAAPIMQAIALPDLAGRTTQPVALMPGQSHEWTVTVTNTGNFVWTDFHVETVNVGVGGALLLGIRTAEVTNGFGAPAPISFDIDRFGVTANLRAKNTTRNVGRNGGVAIFSFLTISGNPGGNLYQLRLTATSSRRPAPGGARQNPGGGGGGGGLSYDAQNEHLSFTSHRMTVTGFGDTDPVIQMGAELYVPDFQLDGELSDGSYAFGSTDEFIVASGAEVFLRAHIPTLDYDPATNTFVGAMTDVDFLGLQSPRIAEFADLFDPSSANFDAERRLYFTYVPGGDLASGTQGFSMNSGIISGGTVGIFAAIPVPEPSSLMLFSVGALGMICRTRRGRQHTKNARTRFPIEAGAGIAVDYGQLMAEGGA